MTLKFHFPIFIFFYFISSLVFGDQTRDDSEVTYRFFQDHYFFIQNTDFSTSPLNPDNRVFHFADQKVIADIRPDLTISKNQNKFVLRPRWLIESQRIQYRNPDQNYSPTTGKLDLSDAYLDFSITEKILYVFGLQYYQWGPAELLNPSGPVFHFNTRSRSPAYKEKGKVLSRLNVDWNNQWSSIFIVEPISNAEEEWIAEENFTAKALLKTEYRFANVQNYMGFVFGKEEKETQFIGEYFNFSPTDGISIYLDGKQNFGRTSFRPANDDLGFTELKKEDNSKQVYNLITAGWRYEGRADFRMEYIYNQNGWNKSEFDLAYNSTQTISPYIINNIGRFARPGLEFLGRHYTYLSLRIPDLGKKQNASIACRSLLSLTDQSSSTSLSFDRIWNDSTTLYLEGTINAGATSAKNQVSELNFFDQKSFLAGLKWSI